MNEDKKTVKVAATLLWCYLDRPNTAFGQSKFMYTATELSPAAVAELKDIGLSPRTRADKPEWGFFMNIKSSRPILAFDKNGEPIEGSKVGNGSKAIITVGGYEWKVAGKKGTSPTTKRLIITQLVEFVPFDDEDGDGVEVL